MGRTHASWLVVTATIHQWLSSSLNVHHREINSLWDAHRAIILPIVCSLLEWTHIWGCLDANLINTPMKCYGKTPLCRLVFDLQFISINIMVSFNIDVHFWFDDHCQYLSISSPTNFEDVVYPRDFFDNIFPFPDNSQSLLEYCSWTNGISLTKYH